MGDKKALAFDDFKAVTEYIYMAVDKMETLYKSLDLTEAQKSELGRLGGMLHDASHEIGHLFLDLESLPVQTKDALRAYYGH